MDLTDNGIENEQGLHRLRDMETRLQGEISKIREDVRLEKRRLVESKDFDYRRLQQVHEQSSKLARKREDTEAKVLRLQTKSQVVQVCIKLCKITI